MAKTRVTAKVVSKGPNLLSMIKAVHQKVADGRLRVGVFADAGTGGQQRDDGLTNVEIAAIHEFGAPEAGIPERSFIRATFETHRAKYGAMIRKLLPGVIAGKMSERLMFDVIGQQVVSDVNALVRSTQGPGFMLEPLKPATIARKGSSRPLIDTGRMLASVTYVTTLGSKAAAP